MPTIASIEADITYKKMSKSVVFNFFDLIKNANYKEAIGLTDNTDLSLNILPADTLDLKKILGQEFSENEIVGAKIIDVLKNTEGSSIVKALISYKDGNVIKSKLQSILVNNTLNGLKISLNGLIKSYNIEPNFVTVGNKYSLELKNVDYVVDGINLKIKVSNNTYEKTPMKGFLILVTSVGNFKSIVNTDINPKVVYNHNFLFSQATGEPQELFINFEGSTQIKIPIKIQ